MYRPGNSLLRYNLMQLPERRKKEESVRVSETTVQIGSRSCTSTTGEMDSSDSEEMSAGATAELVLTADGRRLFKIRHTAMEMLRDRGYLVSDAELRLSLEDFCATFGPAPTRDKMNLCATKLSNPEDRILVIFPQLTDKERTGLATVKDCAEAMKANGTRRVILVVEKPLTPPAKQFLSQMDKNYKVDVFQESELLVNIMDNVYVPTHQILLPEEEKALLEKYSISKVEQLAKLPQTDPVAHYLGLQTGQIIKIVRRGNLAATVPTGQDETFNYRFVV